MAAFNDRSYNLTGTGEPVRVMGAVATRESVFRAGRRPRARPRFSVEEEEPGKDMSSSSVMACGSAASAATRAS